MAGRGVRIPTETLLALKTRLAGLLARSTVRREEVDRTAELFSVSPSTAYCSLKALHQPKGLKRADRGKPRGIPGQDLARFCEIIAALVRIGAGRFRTPGSDRGPATGDPAGQFCGDGLGSDRPGSHRGQRFRRRDGQVIAWSGPRAQWRQPRSRIGRVRLVQFTGNCPDRLSRRDDRPARRRSAVGSVQRKKDSRQAPSAARSAHNCSSSRNLSRSATIRSAST